MSTRVFLPPFLATFDYRRRAYTYVGVPHRCPHTDRH